SLNGDTWKHGSCRTLGLAARSDAGTEQGRSGGQRPDADRVAAHPAYAPARDSDVGNAVSAMRRRAALSAAGDRHPDDSVESGAGWVSDVSFPARDATGGGRRLSQR